MIKKLIPFLILPAMLQPAISFADEGTIYPIKLGDVSPFEGLLLSPDAVASIIADKKTEPGRIAAAVDVATKKASVDCQLEINTQKLDYETKLNLAEADLRMKQSRVDALAAELKSIKSQESSREYYIGGGFLAGAALTILTTFAVSQISK